MGTVIDDSGGAGGPALFPGAFSGAGWRRDDDGAANGPADVAVMKVFRSRRHLKHVEVVGGTCHITWRLHRRQPLLHSAERSLVLDVLSRASEFGCIWHAAVVMDDHIHALVTPGREKTSRDLVRAWKAASSHRLVKAFGRRAPVWQAEYHQRWIHSAADVEVCARYIRGNPARRWPGVMMYPWVLP